VNPEPQDRKAHPEVLASKVHLDPLDHEVLVERKAQEGTRAQRATRARQDRKVFVANLEQLARKGQLVLQVPKGRQRQQQRPSQQSGRSARRGRQ
jgi:Na+-translocating ferredoxin:NAD+ oxidoreductase RnfG subunit